MERQEHIAALFHKFLNNQVTENELQELLLYFNKGRDKDSLAFLIQSEMENTATVSGEDEAVQAIADRIENKIFAYRKPATMPIAALVLLALKQLRHTSIL